MSFENIPQQLKERAQWVSWILVERGGKKTKLPINPKSGQLAKSDDPKTWGTFDQAVRAGRHLNGIGYMFSVDDPYCGIDMDGHVDADLIDWFGSYAERSQSGKGAHIIIRAKLGDGRKADRYEVYDRLRYFVMTGDLLHAGPIVEAQDKLDQFLKSVMPAPPSAQGVDLSGLLNHAAPSDTLERIRSSGQAPKFEALWRGDWSGYESQSQADAALLSILRFWTGGDQAESFRLFGQSGLSREKWTKRADYRNRTWKAVDQGPVYEAPPLVITPQIVTRNVSPWRAMTIDRVLEAIQGTVLEPLVKAMRSPMNPPLPAEVALIKSLVLCGCALSEKRAAPREGGNIALHTLRGADLARVRILTAGGQVANIMAMIMAESGVGKDVGGLLERTAHSYGWMIGTAGSEEGIADAYVSKPNGLMHISEFVNWLDKHHWQSKAANFLTKAFNQGWFSHAMSKRTDAPKRESNYCYPNVYAAVQPGALQTYASRIDLDTGFLGRFLIAQMPAGYFGCPVIGDLAEEVKSCRLALDSLRLKDSDVMPPADYNRALGTMFNNQNAEPGPTWRRLINEYLPRFAVILSVAPGDTATDVELTPDAWRRAGVLVQYFFAQAEAVLTNIHDDQQINRFETLCRRILGIIQKGGARGETLSTISRISGLGTRSKERREALEELISRGLISQAKRDGQTVFTLL